MKIIKWINYSDEIENMINADDFSGDTEEYKMYENVLIEDIAKNKYCFNTEKHQSKDYNCIPVFEDGKIFYTGLRSWSSIMDDAWEIIDNNKKFSHYVFYFNSVKDEDEKLPSVLEEGVE